MKHQRYVGPYWTMNSSEAGAALLVAAIILAIPAIPAAVFGWFIGENLLGNNFAKWGFMILFFSITYIFVLHVKKTKGLGHAILLVFLEYLIWDYSSMVYHEKEGLVMLKLLSKFLEWGLATH